jgi:hypothetical protein
MFENSNFQTTISAFATRHQRTVIDHLAAFPFLKVNEHLINHQSSRVANAKITVGK